MRTKNEKKIYFAMTYALFYIYCSYNINTF